MITEVQQQQDRTPSKYQQRQRDILTLQVGYGIFFPDYEPLLKVHANTWLNTLGLGEILCTMEIVADSFQRGRTRRSPSWVIWTEIRATANSRAA